MYTMYVLSKKGFFNLTILDTYLGKYLGRITVSSGTVQPDFKNKYDLDIYDLR